MMIKEAISKVVNRNDLSREEAMAVMNEIMEGDTTPAQIGSFITALRMKGETIDEITGFATVMREHATKITVNAERIVDTCGTGGDGAYTFNISTIAAFVSAGAGAIVAKHGNRSVSSKCGSADLLKEVGVNIEASPECVERSISKIGIGFLFAPLLHGAMKHAIGPRRELGIRTVFNILGPLTNPAGANCQVLGVYNHKLTESLANVLKNLGSIHSFVVHGMDGLDEITLTRETKISEINEKGEIKTYELQPQEYGFNLCTLKELIAHDISENVSILFDILDGKDEGPRRNIVLLNAACAIVAGGIAKDIAEGVEFARESIESGRAKEKLMDLISQQSALMAEC